METSSELWVGNGPKMKLYVSRQPAAKSSPRMIRMAPPIRKRLRLVRRICPLMKSSHMRSPRIRPCGETWSNTAQPIGPFRIDAIEPQSFVSLWVTVPRYGAPCGLGSIRRIDPHILRREVASPIRCLGLARMQIHNHGDVLGKKLVAGRALIEIERLAAPQYGDASHLDVHERGIKLHPRAPGSRKDAPPIGVAARERRFHQRRSRNGFRDALRRGFGFCAAHFNFNDALRAFAVRHDLQRQRA